LEMQVIKETIKRVNADNDLFDLHRKNPLGPGDYDASQLLVRHKTKGFNIYKENSVAVKEK
jgi:hypothetical protein